jgi:hypothetical protein
MVLGWQPHSTGPRTLPWTLVAPMATWLRRVSGETNGHRIRTLVLSTGTVTTLAGSGTSGSADNANGLLAQFNHPSSAVWHSSGVLYVADWQNNRIRAVNIATTAVTTLAGSGVAGGANGVGVAATFNGPSGYHH